MVARNLLAAVDSDIITLALPTREKLPEALLCGDDLWNNFPAVLLWGEDCSKNFHPPPTRVSSNLPLVVASSEFSVSTGANLLPSPSRIRLGD